MRPKLWCTDGIPSRVATRGAARSADSWTIRSGFQAPATSRRAATFVGASTFANRQVKFSGRRSPGGSPSSRCRQGANLRSSSTGSSPAASIGNPAASTCPAKEADVANATSCP